MSWTSDVDVNGCPIKVYLIVGVGSAFALMLLTIVILSICLCMACRKSKKRKLADVPGEADLHYAELQNLPGSSGGQCDGGACPAPAPVLNSDYATVAEVQGGAPGDGSCPLEQEGDEGRAQAQEDQPFGEPE